MTVNILVGDCREMLASLPDASVQCAVTSPPYFGLRSYGIGTENGEIGLEPTPSEYVAEMVAVFREVRRVLRGDGTLWLNLGDSIINKQLQGIPWMVAFALQADGWYLRSEIIWHKPNPMPESVTDRPTKAHEQVFLLSKSPRYFYDAKAIAEPATERETFWRAENYIEGSGRNDGGRHNATPCATRNRRSVWTIATQPFSAKSLGISHVDHFATMPPELAETCIKAGSSEKGQCPHCGAPWVRQVETERVKDPTRHTGRAKVGCEDRQDADMPRMLSTTTTTGWAPTCACPAHQPVPQMILDPFGGAGTTALVADRLQRDATIIELNPAYAALARERINSEAGMFSPVAAE